MGFYSWKNGGRCAFIMKGQFNTIDHWAKKKRLFSVKITLFI